MTWFQLLLLVSGIIFTALTRANSAKKNAAFYAKRNVSVTDERVLEWTKNIHIPTNQVYRTWWMSAFSFLALIFSMAYSIEWALIHSLVLTTLTSASVSDQWQKWINLGSGLPAVDPNELPKWEFTWKDKSWWIPKFWYGKRRIVLSWIARLAILMYLSFLLG